MEPLVDLPAPSCKGTYFALVEPYVVKIGTSTSIRTRVMGIRMGTFRRVALLAWSDLPEKLVHRRFDDDRITQSREFFKLSPTLFAFINECRGTIGFPSLEEASLWDFGGPLSTGIPIEEPFPGLWGKLSSAPQFAQVAAVQVLKTERFRSEKRHELKTRLLEWLENSEAPLLEFLTSEELATLRGVPLKEDSTPVSPEEASRRGRYYTHLRWHRKPKASCEFCTHPTGQDV